MGGNFEEETTSSWLEENRTSEVDILNKAKEHGEKINIHTPDMICHLDPNLLCSLVEVIRQFLGLPTDGSRSL